MKLLVADDTPNNLTLVSALLEHEGHEIYTASDGIEALELLEKREVDAIISDILMPRMDGYRLCLEVRKNERFKKLPFIFYTSTYTSPGDEKTALEFGADKFLRKPASNADLLQALKEAVERAGKREPATIPPEELGLMKQYNERLVAKLEKKNDELQAQSELLKYNESQLRLQAVALKAAANSILITNRAGDIIWVNPAFTKLTGYAPEEVIGCNPRILRSDKHDRGFYEGVWKTILSGQTWTGEFTNRRKDGTTYDGEQTITPVKSDNGEITHFIGIMNDVSERKKLEAQFLRTQRMESLGTLAGGIAHDLNNVLTPILLSVQVLKMKYTDEDSQTVLDTMETSARRGAEMVKQVLTFSRGFEGKRMEVKVQSLVQELRNIVAQTFPKAIRIKTNVGADVWPVQGDPTQLHQVLMNLSVNARDAMPNGGSMQINAENVNLDETFARMHPEAKPGPYILLSVSDSGIGIPPAIRDRIFDPFFTTKPIGQGTGLGLSTTQGIVRSHGGFITVYSEPGKGSVFKVYLPVRNITAKEIADKALSDVPAGKGETILIVDDEVSVRTIAQHTLQMFGYRVLTASDGAQAVAICAQNAGKISLMLTDMMMPIMDGPAAIRAVRSIDPKIRIVGATGIATQASSSDTEMLRPYKMLHKPYTAEKLLRTIREALDGPTQGDLKAAG